MSDGAELIRLERDRQINELDYTADHDRNHVEESLPWAAAVYAAPDRIFHVAGAPHRDVPGGHLEWHEPWPVGWGDTPRPASSVPERIRELVKAGALIAAEIDRLQEL